MNKPDLSSTEAILALPTLSIESVELVTNDHCEVTYKGRTLRSSAPRGIIRVPVMPSLQAHFAEETDLLFATDEFGYVWQPVLTNVGWRRQCTNGWARLGELTQ